MRRCKTPAAPRRAKQPAAAQCRDDTCLPDRLKAGLASLSGCAVDGVKVHFNSPDAAHLQAHAYAQGNDIHLEPGDERHPTREGWHVVQQRHGRTGTGIKKGGV